MERQIRIVVLDDDAREIQKTEQMLSAYGEKHPEHKYTIACHTQVKTFMEEMCARADTAEWTYDILLMDIYLPDGNGIQCGKILREKGFAGVIVYKSSTADNFPEAMEVDAMQYLIKPVSEEKLFETMDKAAGIVMAGPLRQSSSLCRHDFDSLYAGINHGDSDASDIQIQATQKKHRKSMMEFLSGWLHGNKPDAPRK